MRFNPATEDPNLPHCIEELSFPGVSRVEATNNRIIRSLKSTVTDLSREDAISLSHILGLRINGVDV